MFLNKKMYTYKCNIPSYTDIIQISKLMILNDHHIISPNINHIDNLKLIWTFKSYSTIEQLISLWKTNKKYSNVTVQLVE